MADCGYAVAPENVTFDDMRHVQKPREKLAGYRVYCNARIGKCVTAYKSVRRSSLFLRPADQYAAHLPSH